MLTLENYFIEKGEHEKAIKDARKMKQKGFPIEEIIEITELTFEEIDRL